MLLIITLFAIGLFLLLVEIYFTPGSSIFGLLGIALLVAANVVAFNVLNNHWAWVVLGLSFLVTMLFLFFLFKMLRSKNFSVQSVISDKVNTIDQDEFSVGEEGISVTALRPEGQARFKNQLVSVFSQGSYIEPNEAIKIVKITSEKIIVDSI